MVPKVGFEAWKLFEAATVGWDSALATGRVRTILKTAKGGLPYLIYIIIRASRTARRLRGLEDGAKVGFSLSECLRGFQKSLFGLIWCKGGLPWCQR
jgi:hypothetical protein